VSLDTLLAEADSALGRLKDFQRTTVDHVFTRLFDPAGSRRFLVADEVGLGKTMVAKGVIARSIQHLQGRVPRIDIVYVCSNGDIARQNLTRLRLPGATWTPATRLTLLPKQATKLSDVNFVSFTPGTSFDVDDGMGNAEERIVLFQLIQRAWTLVDDDAARNVFAGRVDPKRFREQVRGAEPLTGPMVATLLEKLSAHAAWREELHALCESYARGRTKPPVEIRQRRRRFIGELRAALAKSCIAMLEPDLIILDEFQRFTHLFEDDSEASELARTLFEWKDAHVLLLSATPYKMYTGAQEAGGQDHYAEFLKTLRFLERRDHDDPAHHQLLEQYRTAIEKVAESGGADRLLAARRALEERLQRVMVRTERLASTPDRNGMLKTAAPSADLAKDDVLDFVALQRAARAVGRTENVVEYWKSSAFVLNFMDHNYKLRQALDTALEEPSLRGDVARALALSRTTCLPFQRHEAYEPLESPNGRVRELMRDTVDKEAHRLLWIPPAAPYYELEGAFAHPSLRGFTKRLIFSSWRFVPRAIASLLSYEAERRMVARAGEKVNTPEARKARGQLLRFTQAEPGGPGAMTTLALLYPSSFLARACDPVRLAAEHLSESTRPTREQILAAAKTQIEIALLRLPSGSETGPADERWYWAAPFLLDAKFEPEFTRAWFDQKDLARTWSGQSEADGEDDRNDDGPFPLHVDQAHQVARGEMQLGKRPDDLADVLAALALGGPGVLLLRSMLRVVQLQWDSLGKEVGIKTRNNAALAAWHFRTLFNQPEVIDLLRHDYAAEADTGYWRVVLRYCVDGCLQAVLDEYTHVLRDDLGFGTGADADKVPEIAAAIARALSLRTANLAVHDLGLSAAGRTLRPSPRRMRCHFALRFGDERDDEGEIQTRGDSVRRAFNSPFWPFVLATTSVGQEGLDFHTYCHAVVHWNLPSNPVDLEQREGRVHRFKGHAVRKNVAAKHLVEALASGNVDPWEAMFAAATAQRPPGSTDIVPYWVYTIEGGAQIERHVWAHSHSREVVRLHSLLKSLTLYRMAFGQARQEDLLRFLQERLPEGDWAGVAQLAAIDISPAGSSDALP
jgi:hypothetical protein